MGEKPTITKECVKPLLETRFISVYDLQYAPQKHYYDATRRGKDRLLAPMSDEEFLQVTADAVTCIVILENREEEPVLLLSNEFRYPAGRFLLSPPAGLIDPSDGEGKEAVFKAAAREIFEETGLTIKESDSLSVVNPMLFSTPGMTDESNALVCAVIRTADLSSLSQEGAEGSECFDGFELLKKEDAKKILKNGHDSRGIPYSVYTWAALLWFVSGMWEKKENGIFTAIT